ncbi:MAG TPA: hypothetical protein VF527_16785 [Pyrinomonadaceae bacterium]|jgi:hypothetical protein
MQSLRYLALLFSILIATLSIHAQGLSPSSLRTRSDNVQDENLRVVKIIEKAEQHYKLGELNLRDKNYASAQAEFDKAVDSVLESGMDVRSNPKLQTFYLQLVERVYRMEVAMPPLLAQAGGASPQRFVASTSTTDDVSSATQQPGFLREQKFEPSPLDELSRLELDYDEAALATINVCSVKRTANINIRGFQLGANIQEIKTRIPNLTAAPGNKFGVSSARVIFDPRKPIPNTNLKGVSALFFEFLDGRVTSILAFYDNSIKWNNSDEFVVKTSQAFNLPLAWRPLSGSAYRAGTAKGLKCSDFGVVAGFIQTNRDSYPAIHLFDTEASAAINRRIQEDAERKSREEEKRRQAFKP